MFGISAKKLFWLVVFIALVFVGVQYGDAYLTKYMFTDEVRQSVKYAGTSRKGVDDIRREVVDKAMEFGIELDPKEVQITKRGPAFTLEIQYTTVVNLRVYQDVLTFNISENGEIFGP